MRFQGHVDDLCVAGGSWYQPCRQTLPVALAQPASAGERRKAEGRSDHGGQELQPNLWLPALNSPCAFCLQKVIYHSPVGCSVKNTGVCVKNQIV